MSDSSQRISDMPGLDPLTGNELVPVANNGKNQSVTTKQIAGLTTASMVGLGNVDNTADTDKPISTAQQAALDQIDSKINVQITRADW